MSFWGELIPCQGNSQAWLLAYSKRSQTLEEEYRGCSAYRSSPRNAIELHMFIGCINYYHDMWSICTPILQALTNNCGLKKQALIPLTDEMEQAFDKMSAHVAADALVANANHNKRYDTYTNASNIQLGAWIVQDDQPVAYFSCKCPGCSKTTQ